MGRAYLGLTTSGQHIAVKVIRSEYADSLEFRRRFIREISAIGTVDSPYTATLLDADAEAAEPWLATPYFAGPSLQQAIEAHGPWPTAGIWRLAEGVAQALHAIHQAGITHRDLKPGNILLAPDGPRVIDFGIARAADASQLTATTNRPGTPAFMAPEQALGQPVGPAADVFALGVVLAYAATARTPFGEGSSDVVLFRVIHQEPDLTGIDGDLRTLIEECVDKRPGHRPTPQQIIARCAAHIDQSPIWLPVEVSADISQAHAAAANLTTTAGPRRRWLLTATATLALLTAMASVLLQIAAGRGQPPISSSPAPSSLASVSPPQIDAITLTPAASQVGQQVHISATTSGTSAESWDRTVSLATVVQTHADTPEFDYTFESAGTFQITLIVTGRGATSQRTSDVTVAATTPTVHCGDSILVDTTLASDLSCAGTGVTIAASNVMLNLGGHTITGSGAGSGVAVIGASYRTISNIVIRNGTITGFAKDIELIYADNPIVNKVDLHAKAFGLWAENTTNLKIEGGNIDAIDIHKSASASITGAKLNDLVDIYYTSPGAQITKNTFDTARIEASEADGIHVTGNTFNSSSLTLIELKDAVIDQNLFTGGNVQVTLQDHVENLQILGNDFTAGSIGVSVNPRFGLASVKGLTIKANAFINERTAGIFVQATAGQATPGVLIADNLLTGNGKASAGMTDTAGNSVDDGLHINVPAGSSIRVSGNVTKNNNGYGIEAPASAVTDGGGNTALANPCTGVTCSPGA